MRSLLLTVLVFFDDIHIYSPDLPSHLKHLETVLKTLKKYQLFAKKSKCAFGQPRVEYLGHVISEDGITSDPSKVEAMMSWSRPKNVKKLRAFLGLTDTIENSFSTMDLYIYIL